MRKTMKTGIALFVIAAFVISGCAAQKSYAVVVNGQEIPQASYEEYFTKIRAYYETQGMDFEAEPQYLDTLKDSLLESMIQTELLKQEVAARGWDVNEECVEEELNLLKENLGEGQTYEGWLEQLSMTDADVRNIVAFNHYIGEEVAEVTEEEVQAYFEANAGNYGAQEEMVKAKHILLETETEAMQVIEDLKAGADFAELAKKESMEEAAATTGGELGYFGKGRMVAEFEEAAFSQEVGTLSETPVKTQFGYHVIFVEDHQMAKEADFAQYEEQIRADALTAAKNAKVSAAYSEIREAAEIEYGEGMEPAN